MSTLIVEVCAVDSVRDHPNADRLDIAKIKGWEVCIGKGQFAPGDKVVYIPYDAVLPPELGNGPEDDPPGRLGVMKYCAPLPKDEDGNRPSGGRVMAVRLRGARSFGLVMELLPSDPDWEVGTNVAEHFGITKWEPTIVCHDAEAPHPRFHTYTDIEHYGNYPGAIPEGEDVVMTEKIHGKNCRHGLVLDRDDAGNADWVWMAGSNTFRRKEFHTKQHRFNARRLVEFEVLSSPDVKAGQIFKNRRGHYYKVDELLEGPPGSKLFLATLVNPDGVPMTFESEFWQAMTPPVKTMLGFVRDFLEWPEPKAGIVLFSELYGRGIQDMEYGMQTTGIRAFDIAVNDVYLDYVDKMELFRRFGIEQVPVLYRGPFSAKYLLEHTDGPTKVCDPKKAGKFSGREGVVITPTKERFSEELKGRAILKSVSDLYAERSGATDNVE